jgi:hypothetical protein
VQAKCQSMLSPSTKRWQKAKLSKCIAGTAASEYHSKVCNGLEGICMKRQDANAELNEINLEAAEILADLVERAIRPYIIAIYAPRINHPNDISQVGTGFLVQNGGEVTLVSARHVYYGQTGTELPGDKVFFVNGVLHSVGDLRRNHIYGAEGLDLACVRLPEMPFEKGMSPEWMLPTDEPTHISVMGYLARDFKRSRKSRTLRPAPRLYSNQCRKLTSTSIVMEYPKSRNRIVNGGVKVGHVAAQK